VSIREAFDRALKRLKRKTGITVTTDDKVIVNVKRVPRFPKEEKSNVVYFNPDVHTDNRHDVSMEYFDNKAILKDDRCIDCTLKKKDDDEKKKQDAIKKVAEELSAMPQDEFFAELEKHIQCDPKTCWGECNGKGPCHIAQDWQQKIHHRQYISYVLPKKGKKKKKKRHKNRRR
jgi:hypothetical protein